MANPTALVDTTRAPDRSGPVRPGERIDAIDIVRGFALFGVLLLNMIDFSGPVGSFDPWSVSTSAWDRMVELAIRVFGEAAFYTTFSFLFGLGFAIQAQRAAERGERFGPRFAVRLTVLALFGLVHGFLIWDGDILFQYAISGFFLLPFLRSSPRTIGRWAVGLLSFTLVLVTTVFSLGAIDFDPTTAAEVSADIESLGQSDFGAIARMRLDGWAEHLALTALGIPWFLGLFLTGLWTVKTGKVANWRNEGDLYRRVLRRAVPVAVVAKGALAVLILVDAPALSSTVGNVLSIFVGGPALGATYVSLLLLALSRRPSVEGPGVLGHLAPVGRMALTNYLSQSIIAVGLFYGYGLGWYGRYGVGTTIGLTVAIFAAQIVLSRWWLARFSYGPLERVWRAATYAASGGGAGRAAVTDRR